jgi:hypothetical protein
MTAPALEEDEDEALLAAVADPAISGGNPVPELEDLDAPLMPVAAPVRTPEIDPIEIGMAEGPELPQVAPALQNTQVPGTAAPSEDATIAKQAGLDARKAEIEAGRAEREAQIAQERDEDARIAHADYLERKKAAETNLAQKVTAFEKAQITDPRQRTDMGKATLAVIFGGLGAAFRSAGGGDSTNHALVQLQKRWDDDLAMQKANVGLLKDAVVVARTGLQDVETGRRALEQSANAQALARYNAAIKQGEAQLRKLGVEQPAIDADKRLVALKLRRDQLAAEAQKNADAHALSQARANYMNARATRAAKARAGGAGGGDATAQVADYLVQNPGDIGGAHRLAARLGVPAKAVATLVNQTKPTESQAKDAKQSAVGLRAVEAIEQSGYVPSREDIQKWLNNSRLVHLADRDGVAGLAGTIGQSTKLLPQSEVEGLTPDAATYFGNVRRFMETIGRAQSGAAISQTEWTNFFNQYGPNSKGGLKAARQYLEDQSRVSGTAGRSLAAGQPAPAAKEPAPPSGYTVTSRKTKDGKRVLRDASGRLFVED